MLAEHTATDEAEDEQLGEARGDELPERLRTPEGRREFFRKARQKQRREAGAKLSENGEPQASRPQASSEPQASRPQASSEPQAWSESEASWEPEYEFDAERSTSTRLRSSSPAAAPRFNASYVELSSCCVVQ